MDTWEWDGTTWLPRTPVTSPLARRGHALAYDAARQRVVLFGGQGNGGNFSDTWEWDGTTWLPRTPVASPLARSVHALAYDAARQRVVLFGGYSGSPLLDTWEWDGTTWLPRAPVTSPLARSDHALAYDAARQRVVLFGGYSGAPSLGHLALPSVTFLRYPCMRLQHLLVLGVVTLALSGCRGCQPRVTQVEPAKLSLDATQLDFPATYVGSTATLAVQVLNSGKASGSVEILTAEPFSSGTATLVVAGGTAEDVRVTFAPTSPGLVTGTLTVGELSVELHGEGLAIPECTTANPCETSAFELTAAVCVVQSRADGESCSSSCLVSGQCQAGTCVGQAKDCSDGNPCTADACAEGGCLHQAVECPALDACRVAYCDADAGCLSRPVDDGVLCGASDCATAFICLGGVCQQRARPNAARDCAYDDLSSSNRDVCVRTLGGDIRCWGASGPRLINGPHRVLAPPGMRFIPNGPGFSVAGVDPSGQPFIYEGGAFVPLLKDGGVYPAPVSMLVGDELVLLADGSLADTSDTNPFRPDAGVRALIFYGLLMLFPDGGVEPLGLSSDFPVFGEPVASLVDVAGDSVCGRTSSAVRCFTRGSQAWSETLRGDAGAVVGSGPCLGSSTGDVECAATSYQFAGGLTRLTTFHDSVLCGLSPTSTVSCVGSNFVPGGPTAGLGDVSMLPVGTVEVPLPGAAVAIAVGENSSFAATDAGVWAWGRPWLSFDAGARPTLVVAANQVTQLAVALETWGDLSVGFLDSTHQLQVFPTFPGARAFAPVSSVTSCAFDVSEDFCGQRDDGGWYWTNWWTGAPTTASFVSAMGRTYLQADGGVVIGATAAAAGTPLVLPAAAIAVSDGCAVLVDGRTVCVGGAPSGLLPARAVVGDLGSGCVLVGTNGVQCWGTNLYGRLGNELASSATAVFIPMPEPVVQIAGSRTHTCALLRSGKVRCWGLNLYGQLGLQPRTSASTPVLVSQ